MNLVILKGRLGKDPELRQTKNGKAVCNFSLATVSYYGGEEHTEWHNIVAWNGTAEFADSYLAKGREVLIQGKIATRKWEDKNQNTRYSTEVVADRIEFCGSKNEANEPIERDSEPDIDYDDADDIPF